MTAARFARTPGSLRAAEYWLAHYLQTWRGNVVSTVVEPVLYLLAFGLGVGALIEARSCERFAGLAPRLDGPLAGFYAGLCESEARHFGLYLALARTHAGRCGLDLDASLEALARAEAELATAPDRQFRFHSGPPAGADGG